MKRIGAIVALSLLAGGGLAAQDTTKAAAAPGQPAAASVSVDEAAVAKTVVDRVAQDTGSVFPVDVGQLILWTKVTGAAGTAIHHVWFHGDTQVGDVELQVGGSPWRTWSRKTVPADWTGPWHVEVRDAAGTVPKRVDVTGGAEEPAPHRSVLHAASAARFSSARPGAALPRPPPLTGRLTRGFGP